MAAAAASPSSTRRGATTLLILLALSSPQVGAVTLKEAQQQPDIYIHYDTDLFNIGIHCGASLVTMYGILCLIWLVITAYVALSGQERKRRSYVDSPQRRRKSSAAAAAAAARPVRSGEDVNEASPMAAAAGAAGN